MPSERILEQKKQRIAEIKDKLEKAKSVVLVDYKGINVADDTKLRADMREADVEYTVIKNSLLQYAFEQAGMGDILPELVGTTAVAISYEDAIAPAKVLQQYSDKLKKVFNIKAGYIDGELTDADTLRAIALLPSKDTLVAMVAGSLNGIIASLARGLSEVAKKQESAA